MSKKTRKAYDRRTPLDCTSAASNKISPSEKSTDHQFPCVVQMASIRTSPRTQAKNKGISLEKSSSVEETQKQFNHKAS
ncbi:unnamed protein product [Camellia sinensis]